MRLADVVERLNDRLRIDDYADVDPSTNGLQVGGTDEVERVTVAVDAAVETIDAAIAREADLLVVHHGLFWGGLDRLTGRPYDRVSRLIEADCALYAAHLPLDGHQSLGNAAGVADVLDLEDRSPFGSLGGESIGLRGRAPAPMGTEALATELTGSLDTGEGRVRTLDYGPAAIEEIAVVTGAGADWFDEAVAAGVDALVIGEGKARLYHEAREAGLTVVLAGHYATETFGVRNLGDLLGEWGLETTYIDHPTGL